MTVSVLDMRITGFRIAASPQGEPGLPGDPGADVPLSLCRQSRAGRTDSATCAVKGTGFAHADGPELLRRRPRLASETAPCKGDWMDHVGGYCVQPASSLKSRWNDLASCRQLRHLPASRDVCMPGYGFGS